MREINLYRLAKYLKVSEPVDPSWEEEYGDVATYDEPEEETFGKFTKEEFIIGEVNLALMGYDVENMDTASVLEMLRLSPEILQLRPKFGVHGRWVHSLPYSVDLEGEYTVLPIQGIFSFIESVITSTDELCVTDASVGGFWSMDEKRKYGLVFEGVCKVLWNANMYSNWYLSDDDEAVRPPVRTSLGDFITAVNQSTEGWIVPAECKFVGIIVEEDESFLEELPYLNMIIRDYNLEFNPSEKYEKEVVDIQFYSLYDDIDSPVCDLSNPEFMYEPSEEFGQTNLEYYNNKFLRSVESGDLEEIKDSLENGADLYNLSALNFVANYRVYSVLEFLLNEGLDLDKIEDIRVRNILSNMVK